MLNCYSHLFFSYLHPMGFKNILFSKYPSYTMETYFYCYKGKKKYIQQNVSLLCKAHNKNICMLYILLHPLYHNWNTFHFVIMKPIWLNEFRGWIGDPIGHIFFFFNLFAPTLSQLKYVLSIFFNCRAQPQGWLGCA